MRKSVLLLLIIVSAPMLALAQKGASAQQQVKTPKWKLVWSDEFKKDGFLDPAKWSKIPRNGADWGNYLTDLDTVYSVRDGNLILRGIVNSVAPADTAPYLTGGVWTKGKFAFCYGKIEIRAKIGSAQGAWPAFWMLAEKEFHGKYPRNGEIDLMEHLNYDSVIYQTIHSYYTLEIGERSNPVNGAVPHINASEYNVFGLEWFPDKLVFTLNGTQTLTYPRIETDKEGQYPFDQPFYLLLDMQLGGSWVGAVDASTLPIQMDIDWVRVYQTKAMK